MRHLVTGLGLATAALLVSAAPAAAQSPQARQPARADTQERTICMRLELSNTRIVRRVCRTESEWRARGELDDDMR